MGLLLHQIMEATGGKLSPETADLARKFYGVSTDSRTIKPGELFVPLKGATFDGHDFIQEMFSLGLDAVIAERKWLDSNPSDERLTVVAVEDSLKALGDIAASLRRIFDVPLVGITGSNGKTTTKEMLASILSIVGEGLKTEGNLNNLIGLPKMLLKLRPEHKWAVLEMGMSESGEIDRLAEIALPSVGVVTNIFPAHMESMGSIEAVAKAKGELFLRLKPGAWAISNNEDENVSRLTVPEGVNRLTFGLHKGDITAGETENLGHEGQRFKLIMQGNSLQVKLHAFGRHNIQNALAAAAAAVAMGITSDVIKIGLESFRPVDRRFRLEDLQGFTLVDDSYNANPGSVAAALVALSELKEKGRAIAVLGDMLELGESANEAHKKVGRLAATCVSRLYLFGHYAEAAREGAIESGMLEEEIIVVKSREEVIDDLSASLESGDIILVKGSRGMKMDLISAEIRKWRLPGLHKGAN